ncbi:MAG: exopolysaccharide Pel transporter PelG [Proteobacteria bacterium]|nr:exopolysaccharide Pel transporter PelG [Pseudomonadota bacterium]
MARINVALSQLSKKRSLSCVVAAYVYAALLIAGPWIFTVAGLSGLGSVHCGDPCDSHPVFRSIVIYNALISLVLTSPLVFQLARHASERLYHDDRRGVCFALLVACVIFALSTLLATAPFYLLATTLDMPEKIAAIQNAALLGYCWLLLPFVGISQRYNVVILAFAAGAVVMIVGSCLLTDPSALALMLWLNASFTVVDAILLSAIVRRFGIAITFDTSLVLNVRRLWQLPVAGLAYALGIWIDKVIMWYAADQGSLQVAGMLRTMPSYDTPMFWAQLASIPVMAVHFVNVETRFHDLFEQLYGRIQQHASLRELTSSMQQLRVFVLSSIVGSFISLLMVAVSAILISIVFMNELGLRPSYMSIQRIAFCTMGFHTSAMLSVMLLLYLDLRSKALVVVATHALLNAVLTAMLLPAGQFFYGYGNMIAAALAFLLAFAFLIRELPWLLYHAFVTNNGSL